jgi:uncharacterized Zn finger protein
MSYWSYGFGWEPRKTAAQRRAEAERAVKEAARRGQAKSPVRFAGRKIGTTFWGKAWCDNLERYRDFAYRLDRGRSYLRSGSVLDLQIKAGQISAEVLGSSVYKVAIEIDPVSGAAWKAIRRDCAGAVGSRLDLLGGRLSEAVMARLCAEQTGLFPAPSGIRFSCSCPDYATMCKHVAATMYGIGVRLDHAPELLFTLRRVSLDELAEAALTALPVAPAKKRRILVASSMASLFGIELADERAEPGASPASAATVKPRRPAAGKAKPRGKASAKAKPKAKLASRKPAKLASRKPAKLASRKRRRAASSRSAATS